MYSLHRISVSIFIFFLHQVLFGGNPYHFPNGAPEVGMGSVCIMKAGFWQSFNNQALLAVNHSIAAGVNYENRFGLEELATCSAAVIFPAGNSSLGFHYSRFGYREFYRESAGIASGLRLSENIAAGVQADYISEKTSGEYPNSRSLTFEAGMTYKPSSDITVAVHLFNPVPGPLRKVNLPSALRTGAGIQLSHAFFTGAEAEMTTGRSLIFRWGFEYEAVKNLWMRGGFCTENRSFSFGMGYLFKTVKIDLSFVTHNTLGITSSASLILLIK